MRSVLTRVSTHLGTYRRRSSWMTKTTPRFNPHPPQKTSLCPVRFIVISIGGVRHPWAPESSVPSRATERSWRRPRHPIRV